MSRPRGAVNEKTRLALVSALSFVGKWRERFPEETTKPRDFLLAGGAQAQVQTMSDVRSAAYARVEGARLLELPYRCGDLTMLFVLPETGQPERISSQSGVGLGGLASKLNEEKPPASPPIDPLAALARVERSLSAETLAKWSKLLKVQKVSIHIPRFDVEPAAALDETLQRLGVRRAYGNADFSGITTAVPLQIQASYAQARVEVDEEGTRATAATAIVLGSRGAGTMEYPAFHADHPFLFFLRDVRSGAILFLGRVVDPRPR